MTEYPHQQPTAASASPDSISALATPTSFAPGVAEQIGYYVYLLIDPRDNSVFYVGKGAGDRGFAHVAEAGKTTEEALEENAKLTRIREIEAQGKTVRIDILRHGMSEREAFLVEAAAIELLLDLTNVQGGHNSDEFGRRSVSDINARYGAAPVEIDPSHCVVLIRINRRFELGMADDALYEATRKWWTVSPRKVKKDAPGVPQWAMAVYRGIVRAVYRIEAWERPTEEDIAIDPKRARRWGFRGKRDPSMEETYLYRDVSSYLSSQNPIRYVHCEPSCPPAIVDS